MNKLFIIGLPRTGTTSISVALLDYGFKVAHTAYTKRAFELADAIADAPCFCDFKELDALFPQSKFVYLDRYIDDWLPSIKMLLHKMIPELAPKTGYLHPVLKRSMNTVFSLDSHENPINDEHLTECYRKHKNEIYDYFAGREDFISINISQHGSLQTLLDFLLITSTHNADFPHLNIGKQVDNWKEIKHKNKVNSLSAGKEHKKFFDYAEHKNTI